MNYIINPIWFYLMEISNEIKGIAVLTMVICLVFAVLLCVDDKYNVITNGLPYFKKFLIIGVLAGILFIFTPSKDTCKEMMVASLVTEENLSYTKEEAKDFVDYIFEKIEEMQDEDSD